MGEKTYEAIYKIAKNVDSDVIHLWVDHAMVKGILLDCNDSKCISGVITLKDATVKCHKHHDDMGEEKMYKWINIPACHIKAFTFQCCLLGG